MFRLTSLTFQPFGSSLLNETLVPGFGYSLTTRTKNLAIGETHVFSPKVINFFHSVPIVATETDCLEAGASIACYGEW